MKRLLPLFALALAACPEKPTGAPDAQVAPAPDAQVAVTPKVTPKEIPVSTSNAEARAAFEKGRDLALASRIIDAQGEFQKAVNADKKFALALAYLGFYTPTQDGLAMIDKASKMGVEEKLPEDEQLFIDHLGSWRKGDDAALRSQRKKLAELDPGDWRVHLELGLAAQEERNWTAAEAEFNQAAQLNPSAGAPWNLLGYALMEEGKLDPAIAALTTYTEKAPNEPNAFDSLGEALLRKGDLDKARANFEKATALSSTFYGGHLGVAMTWFFQNDYEKGREAVARAQKAAQSPADKLAASTFAVWSWLAQGKTKEALASVDAMEKEAKAAHDGASWAAAPVLRGAVMTESGNQDGAEAQLPGGMERAQQAQLQGDALGAQLRQTFLWKLKADLRQNRVGEAETSLAALEKAVSMSLSAESTSMRSHGTALVSWAKGEREIALNQFQECGPEDHLCRADLLRAYESLGNADEAEKLKKELLSANRRDAPYLYARALAGGLKMAGVEKDRALDKEMEKKLAKKAELERLKAKKRPGQH